MDRQASQDSDFHTSRRFVLMLPLRFAVVGAAAGAVAGIGVEAFVALLLPGSTMILLALGRILLAGALTTFLGGAVGAGLGYAYRRRLDHVLTLTDAWLRGNLSLRTNAIHTDEIGQIERRLNLIIEHLEEDEQDLDRLRESNTRLTDQVRALAVVEERNRLARELHDSVKQHLFSLAMTASAVRTRLSMMQHQSMPVPAELAEMVSEMETSAQTAQRETTRLIDDLRPAPLQERGLASALNDYTLLFGAQQHLLVYLDVRCDDNRLQPLVTETLYRVAQEALHNVARHAHATRVDVSLVCAQRSVTLVIDDNGIGFDPNRTRKGLGISSMQERLMNVGGRLRVESEPGAGTTIRAEVEIPEPAVAPQTFGQPGSALDSHSPRPRTEAWGWLGQKLMIPVGQTWPWPPAEQERHLRAPVVESGDYALRRERHLWGLLRRYVLWSRRHRTSIVRLHPEHNGVHWEIGDAHWGLRRLTGRQGRAILERNDQSLAAMQHRLHQLDAWTDIIYDDRSYCLSAVDAKAGAGTNGYVLTGESNESLMEIEGSSVHLEQTLPLPLVLMVAARVIDEGKLQKVSGEQEGQVETEVDSASDKALRLSLHQELRKTVRDAAGTLPPDVLEQVEKLARAINRVLPQLRNISGSDHDTYIIRQTIRDYLPTALADYASLPAAFATGQPIQDGKTAREHLISQLALLQQAVSDVSQRLPHQDAQQLLSHGRFLIGKFGKGADASETDKEA